MSDDGERLTLLGLEVENIKRAKVVRIAPRRATGLVKIAGPNDAGKSSVLDSVEMILAGAKSHPVMPIRKGATRAEGVLKLQNAKGEHVLTVRRVWTGAGKTYLTAERPDGEQIKSPQDFLDRLAGAGLGFDPEEFVRMKPAQQVAMLLDVLKLPEDPRALEMQKKKVYDERTVINREATQARARLDGLPAVPDDTPDAEVSVTALLADIKQAQIVQKANDTLRALASEAAAAVQECEAEVARLETALATARTSLVRAGTLKAEADVKVAELTDPDIASLEQRLTASEGTNRQVRAKQARLAAQRDADEKEATARLLTRQIERLDERKAELFASAAFPVPGLGFGAVGGEHAVTLNGVPLAQQGTAMTIKVGMALAMALNPDLRIVLIRNGSLLDDASMKVVEEMAEQGGCHVLVELVGTGDGTCFVLEEGEVVAEPKAQEVAP